MRQYGLTGRGNVANCKVDEDSAKRAEMLWEVLERFTPTERALFVKFGCGRFGLPPPGYSGQQPLIIRFQSGYGECKADDRLLTASTCSSTMIILVYSSVEIMEKRIRTAITFGTDIDKDGHGDRAEMVAFV
jgi:E3 ubiquitin-protein ligase HERC2